MKSWYSHLVFSGVGGEITTWLVFKLSAVESIGKKVGIVQLDCQLSQISSYLARDSGLGIYTTSTWAVLSTAVLTSGLGGLTRIDRRFPIT